MRVLMLSLLSLAVLGCSSSRERTVTIGVDVVTGLVPGPEFSTVVIEAFEVGDASSGLNRIALVEARAQFGQDYTRGLRVAEIDLPPGEAFIRARLLRPDRTLLVQFTRLSSHGDQSAVISIRLTRDCVGVACPAPGGSAALSECLGGQCTDPRCEPPDPEFCPAVVFCNAAEDCSPVDACAERACSDGLCEPRARIGGCDDSAWCDPTSGCTPLGLGMEDAGVPGPDAGVVCGTICVPDESPCSVGYWRCDDGVEPVCEALALREEGYPCGPGQTCSTTGECG